MRVQASVHCSSVKVDGCMFDSSYSSTVFSQKEMPNTEFLKVLRKRGFQEDLQPPKNPYYPKNLEGPFFEKEA